MAKHPRDIVAELYPKIRDLADNFNSGVWSVFNFNCIKVSSKYRQGGEDYLHRVIQYLRVDFSEKINEFQKEARVYNQLLAKLGSQVERELNKVDKKFLRQDKNRLFMAREGLEKAYLEMKKLPALVDGAVSLLHEAEQGNDVEKNISDASSFLYLQVRVVLSNVKENLDRSKDTMYHLSGNPFSNLPRTGARNFWTINV